MNRFKQDFNQPGIEILPSWLVQDLKQVDPKSTFFWEGKTISRKEYIKEQIKYHKFLNSKINRSQ